MSCAAGKSLLRLGALVARIREVVRVHEVMKSVGGARWCEQKVQSRAVWSEGCEKVGRVAVSLKSVFLLGVVV